MKSTPQQRQQQHLMVKRLATAGAVWAVAKLLDLPKVARMARKADEKLSKKAGETGKSLKRAGSNARKNRGLLVAGVSALVLAAGLLGRATMK